jgi:hypothetical protein
MATFGTGVTSTSPNQVAGTAGEALAAGTSLYLSGGKWYKARSNASTTIGIAGAVNGSLGVALNSAIAANAPIDVLITGLLENGSSLLPGEAYVVSDATAGDVIAHSALTEDTDYAVIMGIGVTTTSAYISPVSSGVILNLA